MLSEGNGKLKSEGSQIVQIGSQSSQCFSNAYSDLHFFRVCNIWSTWNNFGRFGLRQFETASDSLCNVRSGLRGFCHLDVSVGDGLSNYFAVTRLSMARPILHEGGWHPAGFKVGDTEPAEAMEALFLDSDFFRNRVQRATKEVRLKKWCPRPSPEEKALFPVANEIAEHGRNGRMQAHLTDSVHRLWSLDSTFPYGLCSRGFATVELLHFETEQFACFSALAMILVISSPVNMGVRWFSTTGTSANS